MLLLYFAFNILLLLLLFELRYPNTMIPYLAPIPGNITLLYCLSGVLLTTGVIVLVKNRRGFSLVKVGKPLLELMLLPAVFIFLWMCTPFDSKSLPDYLIILVGVSVMIYLVFRDLKQDGPGGLSLKYWVPAVKWLAPITLTVIGITLLLAFLHGNRFQASHFFLSLIFYPFYAFFQLLFFLEFTIKRFRILSRSKAEIIFVTAGLFSLIHWPNLLTVVITFVLMLGWCLIYLHYPNLWVTALSMGISVTFLFQLLPYQITQDKQVGTIYVNNQLMVTRPGWHLSQAYAFFSKSRQDKSDLSTFADDLYQEMLGSKRQHPYRKKLWTTLAKKFGEEEALLAFFKSIEISQAKWYHKGKKPKTYVDVFLGFLDGCQIEEGKLYMRGWAANSKKPEPLTPIHVFVNGESVYTSTTGSFRPDLERPHQRAGFQFEIPLAEFNFPSIKEIRIFAVFQGNILTELSYPVGYVWLLKNSEE